MRYNNTGLTPIETNQMDPSQYFYNDPPPVYQDPHQGQYDGPYQPSQYDSDYEDVAQPASYDPPKFPPPMNDSQAPSPGYNHHGNPPPVPGAGGRPTIPPRPPQQVINAHFPGDGTRNSAASQFPSSTPHFNTRPNVTMTTESESDARSDQGSHDDGSNPFSEKSIRLGFIKKVFGLLFCQLLFTISVICLLLLVKPIKMYLIRNDWVYITSVLLTIILLAVFGFLTKLRRLWPWNLVMLCVITFMMSVMLGTIASSLDADEVLMAAGILAAIVLVCAILGLQRKFDFTPLVGFVSMLSMCAFAFGFLNIFFYNRVLSVVFAALGALVYSMFLLLDIQLILKGKHKLGVNPEDYISGALSLYVDIVYIFAMLLAIIKRA